MHSLFTTDELVLDYPIIYGISSALKPIKLAYLLSNSSDIQVFAIDDRKTYDSKSEHQSFELTYLEDGFKCLLIKNKGTTDFFYKRYKKIDFLLCSLSDEFINADLINIIAKHQGISICFALDVPNQKEILNFTQLL